MKVAYVTPVDVAVVPAMALRIAGVAAALQQAGHCVTVVSARDPGTNVNVQELFASAPGIELVRVSSDSGHLENRVRRLTTGLPAVRSALREVGADAVISYGQHFGAVSAAKASGVAPEATFIDLVEWYQWSHIPLPLAIEMSLSMRYRIPRLRGGAICISGFLEEFVSARGMRTLRVPPLMDPAIRLKAPLMRASDGLVHVALPGSIRGKEAKGVHNILAAAHEINARGPRIRLHLVGPSVSEVLAVPGVREEWLAHATMHGRLDHAATVRIVAASDYVAVQRPMQRYAIAGFPSKVVEAWTIGTPVITNLTSDLGTYAEDAFNAVVVAGEDAPSMTAAMARAINLADGFNRDDVAQWAAGKFSPAVYSQPLSSFIGGTGSRVG